jgi:hypothetical protein
MSNRWAMDNKWLILAAAATLINIANFNRVQQNFLTQQVAQAQQAAQVKAHKAMFAPVEQATHVPQQEQAKQPIQQQSAPSDAEMKKVVDASLADAENANKDHNYRKTISTITTLLGRYPDLPYPSSAIAYGSRSIALIELGEKKSAIEDLWKLADRSRQHGDEKSYALVTNRIKDLNRCRSVTCSKTKSSQSVVVFTPRPALPLMSESIVITPRPTLPPLPQSLLESQRPTLPPLPSQLAEPLPPSTAVPINVK